MGGDGWEICVRGCKRYLNLCGGGSFLSLSHRILGLSRGLGWWSRGLGIEPWLGVEPRLGGLAWLSYLECLNEENLNEPNIAICHVYECSGDSASRESVLPRLDARSGVDRLRSPIAPLCILMFVSVTLSPRGGSLACRPRPKTVGPGRPGDS
ncbi:hypothetical protein CRG98_021450 [Punica granatum]|uniref:Uncharacterized protein n=1 Tax=Punica granatum TaxID=22663 RepID=A0A2I0JPG4_PUNGR|nr:hypothetical protein CRG98_021450 [Punica granatum]